MIEDEKIIKTAIAMSRLLEDQEELDEIREQEQPEMELEEEGQKQDQNTIKKKKVIIPTLIQDNEK